jgi:hypothetical protein
LDGLVKNDRSDGAIPDNSPDGSYNLAATIGKGKGRGEFQPAAQTTTPEAVLQINRILGIVYELRQIILKASLNNFEWSMLEFHSLDNNTFGFGGLGPSGTGCQANVSSNGRPLRELIGQYQGSLHTDEGDDPRDFTVMILILRCPPGESIYVNDAAYQYTYDLIFPRQRSGPIHLGQIWCICAGNRRLDYLPRIPQQQSSHWL